MSDESSKNKKPADPSKVASKMVAKTTALEPELQAKTDTNAPVPMQSGQPPMAVHAEVEKTPPRPDPEHPGMVSGGDIIIRLSQVELNQRLNEVGEQTQRANDISTQIAEAFNAMGEQYEKGWELNRSETDETREAIKALTERINSHEAAMDRASENIERQIDRKLENVSGSLSSLDEVNGRQQTLLIRLMFVAILLSLVSIGLHFLG